MMSVVVTHRRTPPTGPDQFHLEENITKVFVHSVSHVLLGRSRNNVPPA